MNLRARAISGLWWQMIELAGVQILGLVVFTTLARLLEPTAFGLVAVIVAYLGLVEILVDLGLSTAIITRQELLPAHINAAFWFNMLIGVVLCVGTIAFANAIGGLFMEPDLAPLLRWASLSIPLTCAAGIHYTLALRSMDFRRPALRTLVAKSIGGVVGVGMALRGFGAWSLVGQHLAGSLAGTVFLWAVSAWRPQLAFSMMRLRELLSVGVPVFGVRLIGYFSGRLDQMVIGRFLGPALLGQYVVGGKLPELATIVVQRPVGAVSLPALSQMQGDHRRMCTAIYHGIEVTALIAFPVFVGLAAVAPELVPAAFGAKWQVAGSVCSVVSIYALTMTLQVFFYPAMIASDSRRALTLIHVVSLAGVGLASLVGTRYGLVVLVIGLIANSLLSAILTFGVLHRRIGLSWIAYCRPCLVPAVAAACMFGAVWFVGSLAHRNINSWITLVSQIIVGALGYLIAVAAISPGRLNPLAQFGSHVLRSRAPSPEP